MTDFEFSSVLKTLSSSNALSEEQLNSAFDEILSGNVSPEQIGAFLMGLAVRGETASELLAGAKALRARATPLSIDGPLLDTCGTGGLGWTSLNTSTASAIVLAACGVRVAKHGNRSVPPKTGSADVLEALGVQIDLNGEQFKHCIESAGVGFLFARTHHSAMRHVASVRASLGIRTIFNLLGPLSNPARAELHILGVNEKRWMRPMAEALQALGVCKAMVVHGTDPNGKVIDEFSIGGETHGLHIGENAIEEFQVRPEDVGLKSSSLDELAGGQPDFNADAIRKAFDGHRSAFFDSIALNASAGLVIAGKAKDFTEGVSIASEVMLSGSARQRLQDLVSASQTAKAS